MKKVLVLIGGVPNSSAGATLSGENSYLKTLLAENSGEIDLSVVSFGFPRDAEALNQSIVLESVNKPLLDRLLNAVGARALYARLATFPIGRLINSLGPLDQGRVYWRHLRRDPAARAALKGSDIIVAADLAAVKSSWIAHKRGWCSRAEYDTRASGLGLAFATPSTNDQGNTPR
ncbi:hypothetical protein [Salinibacterium sp. M195]|uniref:hypothetical protein n=1 Tax=Salinibacterium sp. M195 TaxID=2583374 RepID=UPI001C636DC4|nr:hypothetical protein [Salinibacterium sp. M195]QYH35605.1 hypothetical protein FFT87_06355 [Salinibacterium sp. M195]